MSAARDGIRFTLCVLTALAIAILYNQTCFLVVPKEVIVWIFFTVIVSLFPLLADYWYKIIKTRKRPDVNDFFSDGQLLVIGFVFCADAFGSVMFSEKLHKSYVQILLIGCCFISMLLSLILYPAILSMKEHLEIEDKRFVVITTFTLFIADFIFSMACKWIAAIK